MWLIVQHVSQRLLISQLGNALNIHYSPNANANASNITLFTFILGAIHSISSTLRSKHIPIIYHCIWEFGVGVCDDVGVCVCIFSIIVISVFPLKMKIRWNVEWCWRDASAFAGYLVLGNFNQRSNHSSSFNQQFQFKLIFFNAFAAWELNLLFKKIWLLI